MTTQLAGAASGNVRRIAFNGGGQAGWRSHTFADGVRSITLTGPLDAATAGRLWSRLSELIAHGCRRLIVDASAVRSGGDEPALLASAFAGRPVSCDAIVVARRGSPLVSMLPAWVGIAWSLSDARQQLATGIVHHERRGAGPGGGISAGERNALAVRQSLRWAERSAREGDYERALAWLATVERVEGRLSTHWQQRRGSWLSAWREQVAAGAEPPADDLR
jgi:hypothetical protein